MKKTTLIIISAVFLLTFPLKARSTEGGFVILSLNDVYRIKATEADVGGFARLASKIDDLTKSGMPILVLHGGDFLSPSSLSSKYKGEQIVDIMNVVADNLPKGSQMFVVPGNHEFDFRGDKSADIFRARVKQSRFYWLSSNLYLYQGLLSDLEIGSSPFINEKIIEIGGIKVGLFGLTIASNQPDYGFINDDYIYEAKIHLEHLKAKGAEFIIALTHLNLSDDQKLLEALGGKGLDLIIGGHEHERQEKTIGGRYILKADSDLESIYITNVNVSPAGKHVSPQYLKLGQDTPKHPGMLQKVNAWHDRYNFEVCGAKPGEVCDSKIIGQAVADLEARSAMIRKYETNLGNWMADSMLAAYKKSGAQVAFFNAGNVRINRLLPQNSSLSEGTLSQLLPYNPDLHLIELTGKELKQVIAHAASNWTGSGHFLQIAGIAYRHSGEGMTASDIQILDGGAYRPLSDDEIIRAVTVGYILNPDGPQDGYRMLKPSQKRDEVQTSMKFKDAFRDYLRGQAGRLDAKKEGRICMKNAPLCVLD